MSIEIKVKRELSDEFVGDVLVTAFDGQYGGCWYWAAPHDEQEWLVIDRQTGYWSAAHIEVDENEDGEFSTFEVDAEMIRKGIQFILDNYAVNSAIRDSIMRGVLEGDAGEIDAEGADCIVQAAVFDGRIVFG